MSETKLKLDLKTPPITRLRDSHFKMPRQADLSLNEKAFILEALREGIRLDNRPLDAYRPVELTFGEDFGQVNVRIGKTR